MLESRYQAYLIRKIKEEFPGAFVMKNDTGYIQGVPDLSVLFNKSWAELEVKTHASQRHEPNQDFYVNLLDEMSFARFIYPENEEEVFHDLQQAFEPRRHARVLKSK